MGLRPARTCREVKGQAYTRYSRKKPRKSYVKAMPHLALNITSMGNSSGYYTHRVDLISQKPIQVRDNALEAGRVAINKYLDKKLSGNYYFFVRVFPHHVIREIKMAFGAGADRIQKGMKHAWGRPSDLAARLDEGSVVYSIWVKEENIPFAKEALRRAKIKLPGKYSIKVFEDVRGTPPEE